MKILVVGPAWIGDMVMAQSLFITLKQQRPNCTIDVLAPTWSLPVLERMPEIRQGIALDAGHGSVKLRYRYQLGKNLRAKKYDWAIVIPRSLKSALVPFFARIPKRTGFKGEMRYGLLNDIRPLDKSVLTQTVQRMVALGVPRGSTLPPSTPFPKLTIDQNQQSQLLKKFNIETKQPLVGLMPGAEYGPAKQWPYFKEAAQLLLEQNNTVLIFGSDKDAKIGEAISAHTEQKALNLCGKTSLADAIDLLGACEKVITNDSGLMHVAAATGCEVIAIYGSSSPGYTPPLSNNKQIHYLNLECSPCFDRICKLKTTACLKAIMPKSVVL